MSAPIDFKPLSGAYTQQLMLGVPGEPPLHNSMEYPIARQVPRTSTATSCSDLVKCFSEDVSRGFAPIVCLPCEVLKACGQCMS